jgi:hypothetical protein
VHHPLDKIARFGARFRQAPDKWSWIEDQISWRVFQWHQRKQDKINQAFDAKHGTDTAAEVQLVAAGVGAAEATRGNSVYRPLWESEFHASLASISKRIAAPLSDFTFVDIGSGKGKLLLLAARYPFRRIVGVEYAPGLHDIAMRNVTVFKDPAQRCKDLHAALGDAQTFVLPDGPVITLIFNSFDPDTTKRVVDNIVRQRPSGTGAAIVIYENVRRASEIGAALSVAPPWQTLERSRRRIVVGNRDAAQLLK